MKTPREIAESYWKAECARDTKAVLEHYHPDATFCPPGQKLVGHDQISTFYDSSGEAFPGLKVEILHEVRNGDESCLEWYATLTDKNGNVFYIPGVNVIKVRDGKFESVHAYFDPTVLNA